MAVMPCAPGMLRTMTVGLPGRWPARSGAMIRAELSVPPPAELPTIMVMVLSLNETTWSADAAERQSRMIERTITGRLIAGPSIHPPRKLREADRETIAPNRLPLKPCGAGLGSGADVQ